MLGRYLEMGLEQVVVVVVEACEIVIYVGSSTETHSSISRTIFSVSTEPLFHIAPNQPCQHPSLPLFPTAFLAKRIVSLSKAEMHLSGVAGTLYQPPNLQARSSTLEAPHVPDTTYPKRCHSHLHKSCWKSQSLFGLPGGLEC
jgi:hypothetical protein